MYSQRVIITQRGLFCNNIWLTFFYEIFLTWILFYLFFIIILFVFNNIFDVFSFSFSFLVQIHSFRLHFSYENNPAPPKKAIKIDKKRHQWNYQFLSTPFHSCIATDLSTNNLCYLTLWSSAKKRCFGGTIGSFTENYIHSLACLLYTITRSSPSAIVALTMTAHNPSFTLFVDPVPRNHSDLVHATGLLPLQCIAFRLLMSCFVFFLYCRRSMAFGTDLSCVRAVTETWWQWLLPALSFFRSFLSSVSTGSHVGPWGGTTFNGISQVVWRIRPVFPPPQISRRCFPRDVWKHAVGCVF